MLSRPMPSGIGGCEIQRTARFTTNPQDMVFDSPHENLDAAIDEALKK